MTERYLQLNGKSMNDIVEGLFTFKSRLFMEGGKNWGIMIAERIS